MLLAIDIGNTHTILGLFEGGVTVLGAFLVALLLLDLPLTSGMLRLGRHLEARLRVAFLEKLPFLGDRYFRSRLTSDMAERGHSRKQCANRCGRQTHHLHEVTS